MRAQARKALDVERRPGTCGLRCVILKGVLMFSSQITDKVAGITSAVAGRLRHAAPETECFIDNLLVRIRFIIVMIRWTGLAPWEF